MEERLPVWKALSEMYLDTELYDYDYDQIAKTLAASGFTSKELKEIDLYEVFPVCAKNLLSTAGIWNGFNDDYLYKTCKKAYLHKNNIFFKRKIKLLSYLFSSTRKKNWAALDNRLKRSS
ncbi:hypothetical protein Q4599_16585 [Cellulophaga lytica]|uniref:DUF7079 family protein n=1 Tax=Cellulophaga lytica TaxID=979 RepID=UPI0026E48EBC|nr:hypothetical protein [Cellulophaga lytica]MDO6855212.1 hypothetical protein [Cellulophaga lytica]